MMSPEQIRQAVLNGARKVTRRPTLVLGDTDLFQEHGLDSLDRMSMLLEVEQELDITLDDVSPQRLTCIQDYVAFLQSTEVRRAA